MDASYRAQEARDIPTVNLAPFLGSPDQPQPGSSRSRAGRALVEALHGLGFAQVIGHGVSQREIDEALGWAKALFDLPYHHKMKAPHPPGPIPHRGYSGLGKEKVYSQADVEARADGVDVGQSLRKISDFKESYEIGSELDPVQQNIWLPPDILPGFRPAMTALYEKLCRVGEMVLHAIGVGLGLDGAALAALTKLMSDRSCQLRLLHYPAIAKEKLENEMLARLPAHHDWGTFTMLFQDKGGGLELRDPVTQAFLKAPPQQGAFVLNVGDMLQRFSNDYFTSALHRVSVPDPSTVDPLGIPPRHSIPFFVCPDFSHTVSTLPGFVAETSPAKYEPVRFDQYGAVISRYQYQGDGS
ncbi:putative thymine dioxygenase protein [Rosellinia necatrix]|uniref:Putative thymine dioxygenase protein n=1 Tax=Rosellinia necatrix TaxID=77044 RepID=A0A1S7UKZ7_ROSNE|nr:putative thymine dioxygenase protein [Rosellinia necatrix]